MHIERYTSSCDVYSLAITLTEAIPSPPNGLNEQPFKDMHSQSKEIDAFIRDEIKAKVDSPAAFVASSQRKYSAVHTPDVEHHTAAGIQ